MLHPIRNYQSYKAQSARLKALLERRHELNRLGGESQEIVGRLPINRWAGQRSFFQQLVCDAEEFVGYVDCVEHALFAARQEIVTNVDPNQWKSDQRLIFLSLAIQLHDRADIVKVRIDLSPQSGRIRFGRYGVNFASNFPYDEGGLSAVNQIVFLFERERLDVETIARQMVDSKMPHPFNNTPITRDIALAKALEEYHAKEQAYLIEPLRQAFRAGSAFKTSGSASATPETSESTDATSATAKTNVIQLQTAVST